MNGLKIVKQLNNFFERYYKEFDITYAILFGSALSKYFRKDSDVDIAVRFSQGAGTIKKLSTLVLPLEELLQKRVDLVDVLQAPPTLRYVIFTEGKLVFCKNKLIYIEDKAMSFSLYLDFKYVNEYHFRRIMNAIRRLKK